MVEELGLEGTKEKVSINVANDQKVHVDLMSATIETGLKSLDGRVDTVIVAKTPNSICGGMKPTNWLQIRDQWKHLRVIPFPKLGKRSKIDVLIGSDYYNLLFPMKEVRGGDGEPSARLCPLGWTGQLLVPLMCTSDMGRVTRDSFTPIRCRGWTVMTGNLTIC